MASKKTNPYLAKLGGAAFVRAQRYFQKKDATQAERIGERLGRIGYRLDRKHRDRTLANLRLAFPDMSEPEREALALGVFQHFGRMATDFLRSPVRTDEEVVANMEPLDLTPYLEAEARGKGVIAVSGHMGNWERFAHYSKAIGKAISVVARDANDTGVQSMVASIRSNAGVDVLSRGNSARAILTKLKNREIVGLLPDQNSGEAFLPFFGKPCGTVLGPGVIHLRTGAPIVCAYCVRVGPGKYKIELSGPFEYTRGEATPEQIMTDLNAELERVIRKYPDQWLWLHDRWKSARKAKLL